MIRRTRYKWQLKRLSMRLTLTREFAERYCTERRISFAELASRLART